ncbi:alpha/beta hydrolase [Granulicella sp. dw_53]|uniref:alpha/beta fold hydrolase n=1 Tax=Granulicella sp. dw_53 TaxID=2719792 RepID=UPI001BD260A2|nr:alpha/beta hydrolase [Granulicella sp. dw_53]
MKTIRTDILEIAYEEGGPQDGSPVLLLHGWPDAPRGWNPIAQRLHAQGWRTIAPYLRGTGPTRFLHPDTPRVGTGVALAQDAIDLMDRLGVERFAVVGHDWGARAAYTLVALFPQRITSVSALALAYQPHGLFTVPSFDQSRRFWYQWFLCVEGGLAKVQDDPVGFARIQWDTWSPLGWFDETEFSETAKAFLNPDWVDITGNAYRSRWRTGETWDPRYELLQQKLAETESISTPTLMLQGASDRCDAPSQSEGLERCFTGGYQRILLDGVGHFPHREAPDEVATNILRHLQT